MYCDANKRNIPSIMPVKSDATILTTDPDKNLTLTTHITSHSGWGLNNSRATNPHSGGQNRPWEADSRWSTPEIPRLYTQKQLIRKLNTLRWIYCRNTGQYPRLYWELSKSLYIYHRQCKHSPCFYYRYIRNTSTVNPGYFPSSTLTYQKACQVGLHIDRIEGLYQIMTPHHSMLYNVFSWHWIFNKSRKGL